MTPEITKKQKAVLDLLPDTRRNIAEELDVSIRAIRYRMEALEDEGYEFQRNSDGVWEQINDINTVQEEPFRVNTYDKAQITKDVNDGLAEIEREIKEVINNIEPQVNSFDNEKGKSTLVIPRTDDHFGASVRERSVNYEFTTEIAKERVNHIIDDAINKAREKGDVEECILGLFGDHIDGETVYDGQLADIEEFLREQIKKVSSVYIEQIKKLSDEFENVKVVTCPGNHGSLSGVSNADDIVFDQVKLGIDLLEIDNVEIVESNGSYVSFDIRGHDGYARHGDCALSHASTSSGKSRWLEWKEESDYDIAYHGHHHQLRLEPVGHSQLFQCGTIVPPSLFVDSIGKTGVPRAFYHFATDENPVDEIRPIDFN